MAEALGEAFLFWVTGDRKLFLQQPEGDSAEQEMNTEVAEEEEIKDSPQNEEQEKDGSPSGVMSSLGHGTLNT